MIVPIREFDGSVLAPSEPDQPYVAHEIVVKLSSGVDAGIFDLRWGTRSIQEVEGSEYVLMSLAGTGSIEEWSRGMIESGDCADAHPNYVTEAPESNQGTVAFYEGGHVTSDVFDQDALIRIGAPSAHAVATGAGIVVAVIDTGIDGTHPDLAPYISPTGYDFVDGDTDATDEVRGVDADGDGLFDEAAGHGTHVAGLVHAVAPDATLMPVRVLDTEGRGTTVSVARGIRFAIQNGAGVINLSLGMETKASVIKEAIAAAKDAGIVVVSSAGNRGVDDRYHFPARLSDVISVASTNSIDEKPAFSNFGPHVMVSAPGEGILSTYLYQGYAIWSGTSMSTPLVAGAAALRLAIEPGSAQDVADAIRDSAEELDHEGLIYDGRMGDGRLNLAALVLLAG